MISGLDGKHISRRALLAGAGVSLIVPAKARLLGGATLSPPTYPRYASSSFWYQSIPSDATLNTNSANLTDTFVSQVTNTGGVGMNTYSYTAPLFNPQPGAPIRTVVAWDCFDQGFIYPPGLPEAWQNIPDPLYANPAYGTDNEMILYDVATDTLYEFWGLLPSGGGWEGCAGGATSGTSTNPGYWSGGYGITATGLNYSAGQILAAELQAGVINHVMGMAPQATDTYTNYSWPAQRSDGFNPDNLPNQIPEGLRCRLDPTIDVASLDIHPIAKIIAVAAQNYGFVIWDKTASNPSIRLESAYSFTLIGLDDPYPALFNGTPYYDILNGFPWSSLQWMPMNYGQPTTNVAYVSSVDPGNNSGSGNISTSVTAPTMTDGLMIVVLSGSSSANSNPVAKYNGVTATLLQTIDNRPQGGRFSYLYGLLGPPSGSNSFTITQTGGDYLVPVIGFYSGVQQSGQPDSLGTAQGNGPLSTTWNVLTDNAFGILGCNAGAGGGFYAGTNCTFRIQDGEYNMTALYDSGGLSPQGSYTMTINCPNDVATNAAAIIGD